MASIIVLKKGQVEFEKGLKQMDWDTEKFEEELEMYANTQSPEIKEKLRKQYNKFMGQCGWPIQLVVSDLPQLSGPKSLPKLPAKERLPELSESKPQAEPIVPAEATPTVEAVSSQQQTETTPVAKEAEAPIPSAVQEPDPNALTPEQIEEAKLVGQELIPEPTAKEIEQQEYNTDPQEEIPEDQPKTSTALEDLHPETKKEPEVPSATARFTFADANLFKRLFEAMHLLNDEITLKFDMNSLMVRHMDPSRVAMFDCTINKDVFEEWSVTTPGLCSFNATEVNKIIFAKPPKKGTIMVVSIDGTVGRITFTMKDNRTRERSFPTLEPSLEDIPQPKINFNASYKITSKEFAEDIEELAKLGDHVTFLGTNDTFEMKAEGDYAKGNTIYKRGDDQLLDISVKEESKATFNLSYLKDFVDPALSDITTIEFSTNMPIKVTMLTTCGDLVYYLAPRLETE